MKLNRTGIGYIAYMFDEFEVHVNKVATAIQDKEIDIDLNYSCFCYPVSLHWKTYWHDEVWETGYIQVNEEDFLSMDYEATRDKYKKLREEKKQREEAKEAESERRKVKLKEAIKKDEENIITEEKATLKRLMDRYPELVE